MSEESSPTVSLIPPVYAQLLQSMSDTIGDQPLIHDVKNAITTDLLKRYNSGAEKKILRTSSALDPRFKGLPILTEEERLDVYAGVTSEAASLEVWNNFQFNCNNNVMLNRQLHSQKILSFSYLL